MENIILFMRNIHYKENNTAVLNGVDFELKKGEVHALVGEHRCGKTSLVKILTGEIRPDRGEIFLNKKKITINNPQDAYKYKIAAVYQSPQVIPSLNTIENIFITRMPKMWKNIDDYYIYIERTRQLQKQLNTNFDIFVPAGDLARPEKNLIDIMRALSHNPDILILDEISNRQRQEEIETLFTIIKKMTKEGKSVIYVTPNVDEIFSIADRVTVLKNGYRQSTDEVQKIDSLRLFRLTYSLIAEIEESEDSSIFSSTRLYNENFLRELPIGIVLIDQNHNMFYINPAASGMIDKKNDLKKGTAIHNIITEEISPKSAQILNSIYTGKKRQWTGVPFGKAMFTDIRVYPLVEKEDFLGHIIIIEDKSKEYHIQEYLSSTEKSFATAEIAAEVAHEINNPLGIINTYIEVLKLQELPESANEKLGKIQKEITRIQDFISSLTQIAEKKLETKKEVDIVSLIKDTIFLFQHIFDNKKINVSTHFSHNKIVLTGDEGRLKQLLINLVLNSVEAILHGGFIKISAEENDNNIIVKIHDNGHGIPDDIKEKIFTPFFSTKLGKKTTGLGLAVCEHIASLHNAKIEVDSKPGEYTCFSIIFDK
ncbi:ATP-binding protein [Spirochaetia bacterium 38H-sp]|uniref:histidine kinase n=1 Tax=Rarispira pelagica TaxID=3141764 RepID=A0ABU9U9Y8_9SPIR